MRFAAASPAGFALARVAVASTLLVAAAMPATASSGISRADFVEAYVACNNAAWTDSRQQIKLPEKTTRADEMRGLSSAPVRGFIGENLYYEGVMASFEPRRRATLGWALATKTFADRGDIEKRFHDRAAANAFLRARKLGGIDKLGAQQAGAIATELHLSAADQRNAITPIAAGANLDQPLNAETARAMLSKIGTHFDFGPHTHPQPGIACPISVYANLFQGKI